jgi:light-harvesting protein B-800-850 alpha chain
MIYGKMWLVVKPSVGVPLMLGAVATTALITHIGILTHTTWYSAYLEGGIKAKHAAAAAKVATDAPEPPAAAAAAK